MCEVDDVVEPVMTCTGLQRPFDIHLREEERGEVKMGMRAQSVRAETERPCSERLSGSLECLSAEPYPQIEW